MRIENLFWFLVSDKNYEQYHSRKPETAVARRSRNQRINPPYLIILYKQNIFCTHGEKNLL